MGKTPLADQPAYKLQKAYNVRFVICISIYIVAVIPALIGIFFLVSGKPTGITVLAITIAVLALTVLFHLATRRKYRQPVLSALSREIHDAYDVDNEVTTLYLTNGKKLAFNEDYIRLDGKKIDLDGAYASAALKIAPKIIHDEIFPVIVIKAKRRELELPITRALIARLSERNIEIINAPEIDAFYENTEKILASYLLTAAMSASPKLLPLAPEVAKSEQEREQDPNEEKNKPPYTQKSELPERLAPYLTTALSFLIFGFLCIADLNKSAASPILMTAALAFAALFRPNKTALSHKILLICTAIPFWLPPFGVSEKLFCATYLPIMLALLAENALNNLINTDKKHPYITLCGMTGAISLLVVSLTNGSVNYESTAEHYGKILITTFIFATVIASAYFLIKSKHEAARTAKKTKDTKKIRNNSLIAELIYALLSIILVATVTFNVLNVSLDRSEPEEHIGVITETNRSGKGSTNADVAVNGENINVTITQKEYDELKPGNTIRLIRYEGALGSAYYIRVRD